MEFFLFSHLSVFDQLLGNSCQWAEDSDLSTRPWTTVADQETDRVLNETTSRTFSICHVDCMSRYHSLPPPKTVSVGSASVYETQQPLVPLNSGSPKPFFCENVNKYWNLVNGVARTQELSTDNLAATLSRADGLPWLESGFWFPQQTGWLSRRCAFADACPSDPIPLVSGRANVYCKRLWFTPHVDD